MNSQEEIAAHSLTSTQVLILVITGIVPVFISPVISAIWVLLGIVSFAGLVKNKAEWIWYCIAISPGLEVWSRMGKAPFIPDEVGKYFLVYAVFLLFIHHIKRGAPPSLYKTGIIIFLLLIPSLVAGIAWFDFQQWVFNLLGPLNLCGLLFIAAKERWDAERFCRTMQMALLPVVAMVIYLTVKTPGIGDIEFGLLSNTEASGGFGSNQVSTVLGVGVVLTMLLILLHRPLFGIRWLNYFLLFYLLFRALLTFSRGGVLVAVVCVIVALSPYIFQSVRSFIRYSALFLLLLVAGGLVFAKINSMTDNMLLLRYEGETPGTLQGSREKTWNVILSGRGDILESDLVIFSDYPLFGSGPGGAKRNRVKYGYGDYAAHIEFSRLLSEHGIGGLIAMYVLILFPISWIRKQKLKLWKGIAAALFLLAILTTFHAAMRTNITPVFYALAAMPVFYLNNEEEDTIPGQ